MTPWHSSKSAPGRSKESLPLATLSTRQRSRQQLPLRVKGGHAALIEKIMAAIPFVVLGMLLPPVRNFCRRENGVYTDKRKWTNRSQYWLAEVCISGYHYDPSNRPEPVGRANELIVNGLLVRTFYARLNDYLALRKLDVSDYVSVETRALPVPALTSLA